MIISPYTPVNTKFFKPRNEYSAKIPGIYSFTAAFVPFNVWK